MKSVKTEGWRGGEYCLFNMAWQLHPLTPSYGYQHKISTRPRQSISHQKLWNNFGAPTMPEELSEIDSLEANKSWCAHFKKLSKLVSFRVAENVQRIRHLQQNFISRTCIKPNAVICIFNPRTPMVTQEV